MEQLPAPGIGAHAEPITVLGCLTITPETYRNNERHHDLAQAVMRAYGYDERNVTEIRMTETCIEVDWLWIEDVDGQRMVRDTTVRTTRYEAVSARSQ